ncbi:hypothetical protein AHIS1636_15960 [Arthrobacter mangrovi]|uniref:Uncharacterized protein n=1 Tax=Arthrobacter mangrovi TaxID=2966350 RepID=A0ABQ5MU43_9MICC|nr:hypothetical protein AHIS1636_15960 [Arthrobacter mangrovi]
MPVSVKPLIFRGFAAASGVAIHSLWRHLPTALKNSVSRALRRVPKRLPEGATRRHDGALHQILQEQNRYPA